jgi:hypothetical protein
MKDQVLTLSACSECSEKIRRAAANTQGRGWMRYYCEHGRALAYVYVKSREIESFMLQYVQSKEAAQVINTMFDIDEAAANAEAPDGDAELH